MDDITIGRFEKYRVGYEWVRINRGYLSGDVCKRFGRWFAFSDWDDPAPAWREFLDEQHKARIGL